MSGKYCLQNTRGVDVGSRCFDSYIRFNQRDHANGLRITATTLGFKDRETMRIRITNIYTFSRVVITAVWNNQISMDKQSTVRGTMKMFPKLSSIWLTVDGREINGSLPADIINKSVSEINRTINEGYVLINSIDIDQFEMLRINNIYTRPDLIFEKLLIYAATRNIASSEMIEYRREIPDFIEMNVTIQSIHDKYVNPGNYDITAKNSVRRDSDKRVLFDF